MSDLVASMQRQPALRVRDSDYAASAEWSLLNEWLDRAGRVIDLGCGNNPHAQACVGIDAFVDPVQRLEGHGDRVDVAALAQRKVDFVQADLADLPFADKTFDVAYSHHVFEHLPNPRKACAEMCRIAHAGAIVTPSIFAEIAFGRPYHRWLVIPRDRLLVFIEKRPAEDQPFGVHPVPTDGGGYGVEADTNPFDMLLNDGSWYQGQERMPRLEHLLRKYWYSHSPVMETVFLWENTFECLIIREDGSVD